MNTITINGEEFPVSRYSINYDIEHDNIFGDKIKGELVVSMPFNKNRTYIILERVKITIHGCVIEDAYFVSEESVSMRDVEAVFKFKNIQW
jgi:hypothetical protein